MRQDTAEWAREEAERLRSIANGANADRDAATKGVEFLLTHAGAKSHIATRARDQQINSYGENDALLSVASLLDQWADLVDAGMAGRSRETVARIDAATDLMEQVEQLLNDPSVHVAAPVMLAGAALEEFLRSMLPSCPVAPVGQPGINSYATAPRQGDIISKQQKKDIDSWAGLRNDAAHGHFGNIQLPNARLMSQGVNLFMQQMTP